MLMLMIQKINPDLLSATWDIKPGTSEPLCATISMLDTSISGPSGWIERIFLVFSGKFCSLLLVNRGSRCRAVKRQNGGGESRRGGQQRKGTHWPGNYRPRYKMQIGELILDGWILGIHLGSGIGEVLSLLDQLVQ